MKVCTVCKELKDFNEYHNSSVTKDGKGYRCKICDNNARKSYRENNKERFAVSARKKYLKHRYNLSVEDYTVMLEKQNNSCAICNVTSNKITNNDCNFAVDHCHETGKIRGLLCNQCNRALGMFLDRVDILEKATAYLKSYK
jgi:hypothetical protein